MRRIDRTAIAKKHAGKWVALRSDRKSVVGTGSGVRQALIAAKKMGVDHPVITRMPSDPGADHRG